MTNLVALQDIHFADPMTPQQRHAAFFELRHSRMFQAVLEHLREEAFAALAQSVDQKRKGQIHESDLSLGGFDLLSQAVVKIKAQSEIAPPSVND